MLPKFGEITVACGNRLQPGRNREIRELLHASWKRWLLPVILIAGLALFFASPLWQLASFEAVAAHYGQLKQAAAAAPLLFAIGFFLIYSLAVAFSLPIASLLTLTGGAVLGWLAAPLVILAATAGAVVVFLAARGIFADLLARRAGPFAVRLQAGFRRDGFAWLLALRLFPVAPFWAVNIVPALAGMALRPYILATVLGITPASCAYIWVARGFDLILAGGQIPDLSLLADWRIIGPLAALAGLSVLAIIWRRWQAGKGEAE